MSEDNLKVRNIMKALHNLKKELTSKQLNPSKVD